mmetsp:Transcript_47103/g.114475  ORF Transcript_47103/g.114475 Transcript_47103/m.114475 type:complete len:234 (+) Transcript_47103:2480-3181(+)
MSGGLRASARSLSSVPAWREAGPLGPAGGCPLPQRLRCRRCRRAATRGALTMACTGRARRPGPSWGARRPSPAARGRPRRCPTRRQSSSPGSGGGFPLTSRRPRPRAQARTTRRTALGTRAVRDPECLQLGTGPPPPWGRHPPPTGAPPRSRPTAPAAPGCPWGPGARCPGAPWRGPGRTRGTGSSTLGRRCLGCSRTQSRTASTSWKGPWRRCASTRRPCSSSSSPPSGRAG